MKKYLSLILLLLSFIIIYSFFDDNKSDKKIYIEQNSNIPKTINKQLNKEVKIIYEDNKNEKKYKDIKSIESIYKIIFTQQLSNELNINFKSKKNLKFTKFKYSPNSSVLNIELNYKNSIVNKQIILNPSILNYKDNIIVFIENIDKKSFEFETSFLSFFEKGFKYKVYLSIYNNKAYIDSVETFKNVNFFTDIIKIKRVDINISIESNISNMPKTLNLKNKLITEKSYSVISSPLI